MDLLIYYDTLITTTSVIFLKQIGSGKHSDQKFCRRREGVSYIDTKEKRFRNAVPACVF
jgi:hypothetical protein